MDKWARINYQPCLPLGDNSSKITGCKRHINLSREAAAEGIVLLKNNKNILPLKNGTKLAVFGKAQIDYVKGGGGSGDTHCEYVKNIYESLKSKDNIEVLDSLSLYYYNYVKNCYKSGCKSGKLLEADIPESLLTDARNYSDTAIITINRYSEEGEDRKNDGKDTYFNLSEQEKKMINTVCDNFPKVIVLLNTGTMIDTSWFADNDKIQAALMIWQGGMEGALATADILTGSITPSGKLVDTCARNFEDYPSSASFHEADEYVKYTEDIFVGYRYFETIPNKKESVIYPFGYGLSYTSFEFSNSIAYNINDKIYVSVDVKNTGIYSGKEVVQVYYQAPRGKITKPLIELCAFSKTKLLKPTETETVLLSFDIKDMASYDDMGAVSKSSYVLEKGEYKIFIGDSVCNVNELEYKHIIDENIITQRLSQYCAPKNLGKRLIETGEYIDNPDIQTTSKSFKCKYNCEPHIPQKDDEIKKLIDVYNGNISLDSFIAQLSDEEMINLLIGHPNTGVANVDGIGYLPKFGIPAPMTADGPAGVRIYPQTGVKTTAFPIATMLACTWNTDLIERLGMAGAMEVKENNLSIWLTPALNIHRSPLCGRNFEYYSEDPLVSGKMAAAMVRGIQSQGIVATPKHFACNNKESNRHESDSIVSERALREIYLKGFEICVKESNPRLIMTAYNKLNSVRTSENSELITGILREEWGYTGLVTTDWWNNASHCSEIIAGNDIRMPSTSKTDLKEKYNSNKINRNQLAVCVKRLLEMILWLE